jgi:hypothetical protein
MTNMSPARNFSGPGATGPDAGLSGSAANLGLAGAVLGGQGALLGNGIPPPGASQSNPGNAGGQNHACLMPVSSGLTSFNGSSNCMTYCCLVGHTGQLPNGPPRVSCPDCLSKNSQGPNVQMSYTPVLAGVMMA